MQVVQQAEQRLGVVQALHQLHMNLQQLSQAKLIVEAFLTQAVKYYLQQAEVVEHQAVPQELLVQL